MNKRSKQDGSANADNKRQKCLNQNKEDEIDSDFPIQSQSTGLNSPIMNPQSHQPKDPMTTTSGASFLLNKMQEFCGWVSKKFRSGPDTILNVTTTRPENGAYDGENPITDVVLPRQADNLPDPTLHQPMFQDTSSTYIRDNIFKEFDTTLLTDPSKYHTLSLDENSRILPGASFIAYCSNLDIHDSITPVIINKGFYPDSNGLFTLNEEVSELECGLCKQIISDHNSFGIGFTDCKVVIKYRDTRQVSDTFSLEADWDVFKFAKFSLNGDTKFYFVKFNIVSLI